MIASPRLDGVTQNAGVDDACAFGRRGDPQPPSRPERRLPSRHLPNDGRATTRSWRTHQRTSCLGSVATRCEPIAVDFTRTPHALILGEAHCGKTAALRTLCREVVRTNDRRSCTAAARRPPTHAARRGRDRPPARLCDVRCRRRGTAEHPRRRTARAAPARHRHPTTSCATVRGGRAPTCT